MQVAAGMAGQPQSQFVQPGRVERPAECAPAAAHLRQGQEPPIEHEIVHETGRCRWVVDVFYPVT
ncbi:Uncharacterised protein [Mycobacterium tuberculosis]|nr:Uncharacterised protein [Mycobacterium tuberculosis]